MSVEIAGELHDFQGEMTGSVSEEDLNSILLMENHNQKLQDTGDKNVVCRLHLTEQLCHVSCQEN